MNTQDLYNTLLKDQGFTVSVTLDRYTGKGYAVATQGNETVYPIATLTLAQFEHTLALYTINAKQDQFIGAWIDQDRVYFDLTEIIDNVDQAIALGKARDQIGIFSFRTFETIKLK